MGGRPLPWFRLYSELLNDRKISRIARACQMPRCAVIGAWVTMLCLANESPVRGSLMFTDSMWLTEDEVAAETGLDPIAFGKLVNEFQRYGMVTRSHGFTITNWDERQARSDSAAERMRRYRARKRAETDDEVTVTSPLRNGYALERDIDIEKEEERNMSENSDILAAPAAEYAEFLQLWKTHFPNKPQPRTDNKTLQGKMRTRLKSAAFRENWRTALERGGRSSFLDSGSWFDAGWFLKNDNNWEKVANGNYDDKAQSNGSTPKVKSREGRKVQVL